MVVIEVCMSLRRGDCLLLRLPLSTSEQRIYSSL